MGDINVQLHEARQRRIVSLYLLWTVEFVCPLLIGEQKAFDSLWQVYNFWALE